MVPLALFSEKGSTEEKQALAQSLLSVKPEEKMLAPKNRFGKDFGKPEFPDTITADTALSDLDSEDSWYTLNILQIDHDFLAQPVEEWTNLGAYLELSCY